MSKKRIIKVKCDFVSEIKTLFNEFSSQLSDGYWENSGGEWGTYDDRYYPDIWNCFNFDSKSSTGEEPCFIVILKGKPTWSEAEKDCIKFHSWTDKQIIDYLKEAIMYSIEEYPEAFFRFTSTELDTLNKVIDNWELFPQKLTHSQLVEILGYDFIYVEDK